MADELVRSKPNLLSATTRFRCGLFAPLDPCAALSVNETVPPPAGTVMYVPTYAVLPSVQALPDAKPFERTTKSLPLIVAVCAQAFAAKESTVAAAEVFASRAIIANSQVGQKGCNLF